MNGHPNIDTTEATQHLKNILNLNAGKPEPLSTITVKSEFDCEMAKTNTDNDFTNEFQKVELSGEDINVSIYGTEVVVYSGPLNHNPSLRIMIKNVVDYGWETKYYVGRLISIHHSMKYLAYCIKSPVTPSGFVRVMKPGSNSNLLLRGFKGSLKDLSFAYSFEKVILGCVDETGQLFVYEILDNGSELTSQLCMHILKRHEPPPSVHHRVFWCPFVPDGSGDDMSMLLCVTHDERAEIWKVDSIMKEFGNGTIYSDEVTTGFLKINQHTKPITAAAFSPDGIALATASLDGEVKFFQINMNESGTTPKYLHQWSPHGGKPLSCLVFLDDLKNASADVQYWKFAITGADNNQELKLWSCKTWFCLQTISFKPNPADAVAPCLKIELDLSGRYFFLSDINRKVVYVLKIRQDMDSGQAFICSLSEFAVKYPVLSLAVVNVSLQKSKSTTIEKVSADEDDDDIIDEDDDVKDDDSDNASDNSGHHSLDYLMKLYWIHTKSMQRCRIIYSHDRKTPLHSASSGQSSQDSFVYRDGLTDLMTDTQTNMSIIEGSDSPNKCLSPVRITAVLTSPSPTAVATSLSSHHAGTYQSCDDILLTPKDFTSPSHPNLPSVNMNSSFKLPSVSEVCSNLGAENLVSEQENVSTVSPDINACSRRKSSQHSSTSSPSREVAEILSPRQLLNHEHGNLIPSEEKESEMPPSDELPNSAICDSPQSQSYQLNNWPQISDPDKEYKVASRGDSEIHVPHSLEQHRHNLTPLDDGMSPRMMGNDFSFLQVPYFQRMEQAIESLTHKITSVSDVIHQQSQAIQYIQNELQELQQMQKYTQSNLQNVGTLDSSISNKMEQLLSKNAVSEYSRIENLFNKRDGSDMQRMEQQSAMLTQNLLSGVNLQLEKVVKQEMDSFVPHITKYVDKLFGRLQDNLLQKLNDTDSTVKECIIKHLKSKVFGDTISQSIIMQLQQTVQAACRDTFQSNVIPAFDKACSELVKQMNEIFIAGTTDYIQQLDRHRQVLCGNFESSIGKLQEQLKRLHIEANSVSENNQARMHQTAVEMARQNEILLVKVRQTVQEEVRRALKAQATSFEALRSQTATPVPHSEPTVSVNSIMQLVKQGRINDAFQQALSAVDVKLVLFLCEAVSVDQVFGPTPCPLAQHVLLSLIHQLSGDLAEKTELKVRYIEDAIASLDNNSAVTKEHSGAVLHTLEQRITAFMERNANHVLHRNLRRILMSINSLLK